MLTQINWSNLAHRKQVIAEILGYENTERKSQSVKELDVYRGFIRKYVEHELLCQYANADDIPVISSINVCKRVVDNDSKLYAEAPKRDFQGVNERQAEALKNIYDDMKADTMLLRSQRYLGLQQQNILHLLPKNKKLVLRPYKMHQVDAIPMDQNPETAQSYIISGFNRSLFDQIYKRDKGDASNQAIADYDDALLRSLQFAVWDKDVQFVMNGKGEVLSENSANLIDEVPFIDVFYEKDFTFFVECGNSLVDFTVQYNTALSTEAQCVKYNGFAQPYLKGPASLFSHDLVIGPDKLLELPTDLEGIGDSQVEFGYANPNSDLDGVREHRVALLNDFLNTRGLSRESFEGTVSHSSGIERLLSMVKDFEKSQETKSIYEQVEEKLFRLVVKWHNAAVGTDLLDPRYVAGSKIPDSASISIEFAKPQMVMTEEEKVKVFAERNALGLESKIGFIMKEKGMSKDEATEFLASVSEDEGVGITE